MSMICNLRPDALGLAIPSCQLLEVGSHQFRLPKVVRSHNRVSRSSLENIIKTKQL